VRPRWKVCGITTADDGMAAVEAGADAIGLVFYEPSLRAVTLERAAAISARLPEETWRIGVFVDATVGEMDRAVAAVGLDFLQLHCDRPSRANGDVAPLTRHAIKALRVSDATTIDEADALAARYPECTLLVDTASKRLYGGTGCTGNWSVAAHLAGRYRLFLAGGLNPSNVAAAVSQVQPWAVDVSSGVESSPGRKDWAKLRAFAAALESNR